MVVSTVTNTLFNAKAMFGGFVGSEPGAQAFNDTVIGSLSEFDGQPLTPELVDRASRRICALQAITSEIIGTAPGLPGNNQGRVERSRQAKV
jgi:hypothetical protein